MDPSHGPDLPTQIPAALGMQGITEKISQAQINASAPSSTTPASDPVAASMLDSAAASASADGGGDHNGPIILLLVGMAGSGKTTLTQRLAAECMQRKSPPYIVNLDPACRDPPYPVNIDIRDTVKYKKVMEVYNLGPNGAIVTALNLFATKFNQVLALLLEKKKTHQYILIDTPGQIEVFMWSASGSIITESLAALFPTVLIYVTDLVTNKNPITFISNMTYACSILYKTKLPLVITLNKRDQADPTYAKNWIEDFETFEAALREREDYASNLANSLALCMEEFYKNIAYSVVSAIDGIGMDDFFNSVHKAVTDYETVYRPMYEKMQEERLTAEKNRKETQMRKLRQDLAASSVESDSAGGGGGEPSCFVRSGRDAGQGLSLRLDGEDEDTSSDEEDAEKTEADEDASFGQVFNRESTSGASPDKGKATGSKSQDPTEGGK